MAYDLNVATLFNSQKNKPKLAFHEFIYNNCLQSDDRRTITWRCEKRSNVCKGRLRQIAHFNKQSVSITIKSIVLQTLWSKSKGWLKRKLSNWIMKTHRPYTKKSLRNIESTLGSSTCRLQQSRTNWFCSRMCISLQYIVCAHFQINIDIIEE